MNKKINLKTIKKIKTVFFILVVTLICLNNNSFAEDLENSNSQIKLQAVLTPPYVIGPGDSLLISDRSLKDISGAIEDYRVVVSADGYISVPLPSGTQKNLLVAGLTLDDVASEVRSLFSESLKFPLVYVSIEKFRPVNVYVGGEVENPGVYKVDNDSSIENNQEGRLNSFSISITQAIQIAGGLKPRADITKIILTRGANSEKKIISLKDLIAGNSSLSEILLQPGDAVYIPSAKEIANQAQSNVRLLGKLAYQEVPVTVEGEGKQTGAFILQNDATIFDAIGQAGGLNAVGTLKNIRLSRFDENGVYRTENINVHDLLYNGSKFNQLAVKPGDRIELVASKGKLVRHWFKENSAVFINATLGTFTSSLGQFIVQDHIADKNQSAASLFGNGNSSGSGIISILGEDE